MGTTEWRITQTDTEDNGSSKSVTMGLGQFFTTLAENAENADWVKVNHECRAKQGQKFKATADKEPFTISLVTPTVKDAKDIEFKLNTLKNNITIKSLDGLKVNGLDKMVFSEGREKASFEYCADSKSWILW